MSGVGVGVGVGVGLAVGVGVGEADGDGDGETTALALADGDALGLGAGSTADGLISATTRLPLRSWSWSVCPRLSTRATPWSAARNAVSCAMISAGQAIRVMASGPMTAASPFVVYGPWKVLHPEDPATLSKRKTAVSSVPSSGAVTVPGAEANESTIHDPSNGFRGGTSNTSRIARSGPRIVRVSPRTLKDRLCWRSAR